MEIKGEIRDIIYRNEINSYMIASFETDEEETTIVGYLPFIEKGDSLKIVGNFIEHPEYGRQFKIETFEKLMPESLDSIERYLANGKLKGIGPATAKKMVETFGKEVIHILKYEPEKLVRIKGITQEKAIEISKSFNENWDIWQIVSYLEKFGVGPQSAESIYKKLGPNTIELIEVNPYLLVDVAPKVNFAQIDNMALKMGIDLENDQRIRSGIKYALKLSTNNGHCTVLYENLIQFVKDLLNVSEDNIENNIIFLQAKKEIILEDRNKQEWVYLSNYYLAEKNVAENLITLNNYLNVKQISNFNKKLKKIEKNSELELSEKQREAVMAIQEHNVCVITGGPGTGKTTIIKTIIELYKQEEKKVVLCAPTGRAAKRMTETTGEEAKTLHRLLEIGKTSSDELQNIEPDIEVAPIDADIIIVDEMSMVDIFLMNYLLQAIYKGTKLVLVGDVNQLPSVGPGNVLKDIINSEKITTITLNRIFRQAAKSKIILNSHKVNEGLSFFTQEDKQEDLLEDFFFINENNKLKVLENVISLCNGRLKKSYNYDFAENIQVISPTKKGELGTKELNKSLQQAINPPSEEKAERKFLDSIFREGDRIMQIKNNYDIYWEKREPTLEMGKGVFNGEYGTILNIDEVEKKVKIKFDDEKLVWYSFEELEQIEHSYCITVHKAQRK
ncbi:MAG: ATP-dependent RecD-like DNA helicase [Clostridia bacterium]